MNNAIANETPCHGGILRECDGERADRIQRRTGFGIRLLAMREQRIEHHRGANCRQRASAAAAHGIGHGHAHGRGRGHPMLLQRAEELLEILNRHTTTRTRARHASEIGRIEAKLRHARSHAR